MIKNGILHVHSMYSLHDSTQSPEDIVRWASEHGCKNITLTDHGSLLGVDDFMEMGVKYGINTIPGVEGYLENREHIILIPFDLEGFTAISHAIRDANANQVEIAKNVYPIITNEILDKLKGNTHIFGMFDLSYSIHPLLFLNQPIYFVLFLFFDCKLYQM